MKRRLVGALVAVFVILLTTPAAAERRVALVIGNSAYQYVSRLANPANDAKLMAATLRALGFTLIGDAALVDLDKSSFDTAIQTFGNEIAGADVALFYYAGHGIQLRGSNHLVPIGANPTKEADVDFQMVDVGLVLRQMGGSGTRLNLVILDACRNSPFGGRGLRESGGGLAQINAPEGTLISYATQPGNVALDGTDGDSPFTKALAQTLRRPGLGIFEVFNDVGLAVKRSTGGAQQPWVSSSPIDGNFYFVSPGATPDQAGSAGSALQGEAAQSWSAAKDTTNPAVLEAFIVRYKTTFYADLARARLDDLQKTSKTKTPAQVAALPAAPAQSYPAPAVAVLRQRAMLDEEDPTDSRGKQYVGSVVWRTEQIQASGNQKAEIAVRGDVDIPERRLKMTLSIRHNRDVSLPATHLLEFTFLVPPGDSGGGVGSVPGVLMKSNERARGTPLAGISVKVIEGSFLLGLSDVEADHARNLQLLKERGWLDVPIVYGNQRRAILAIEKGASGERAFESAFSAWGQIQQSDQN